MITKDINYKVKIFQFVELSKKGKTEEGFNAILEFREGLVDDKKIAYTESLKHACLKGFKETFGEAAVEEIKLMKESGYSMDNFFEKVGEFIGKISDMKKRKELKQGLVFCKKIFF